MKPDPLSLFATSIGTLLIGAPCLAGDLNPPAGPVADTFPALGFKTLFQVEPRVPISAADMPFTISQSGSYYLTEDVPFLGQNGEHGIVIDVDDVTIDLMGFTLEGANEVFLGGTGILVEDASRENVIIRNGFLRRWGQAGIDLNDADNFIVENIGVHQCDADGIRGVSGLANAPFGVIRACVASLNGEDGIDLASGSIIGCAAANNGQDGIAMKSGSISGSTSVDNGDEGIVLQVGSITDCAAEGNGGDGFQCSSASISNCAAEDNAGNGFFGSQVAMSGCMASRNDADGYRLESVSTVEGSVAFLNDQDGFQLTTQGSILDCFSASNGLRGVACSERCTVERSTVIDNGLSGIISGDFALIRGNHVANNSPQVGNSAGIAVFNDCFVDGNYLTGNRAGAHIFGDNNAVLRNVIHANMVGSIFEELGLVGNQRPSSNSPATANPWVNITF